MKFRNMSLRKVLLISTVLLISIMLGTGMNKAFAGLGMESLLTSWFDSKTEASINQIDEAITSEKERLMEELREAIRLEIQRSDAELAQFTADETALRLTMLQEYAANLVDGLHIDLTAAKADIIANLDATLAEAMAHLDSSIIVPPPVSIPSTGEEAQMPDVDEKDESSESENSSGGATEDPAECGTIEVDEGQGADEESSPLAEIPNEPERPSENAKSDNEISDLPEEDGSHEEVENRIEEPVPAEVPVNL